MYDDLGRLVAVVDPSGEAATYVYDAVGNLLSIARSSAAVKVLGVTPQSGAVGTAVTIAGTGFSATPTANTVSFNGTTAVVTSSTETQIVTTVPPGATTGPISVTTPLGTGVSGAPFVVNSAAAPVITGFSPTIGTQGTSVTVTGQNFDPAPANTKLRFNLALALLDQITTSNITTTVPATATSGRISVATADGTASSAADFFVPPVPYVAEDVAVTGRMAVGESKAVTIGSANKIGLIVFDGVKDRRISLRLSSVTIGGTYVTIRRPDGTDLVSSFWMGTSGSFVDTRVLPATGTYTILLDPESTYTGNVTLTLYDVPADLSSSITIAGPSVTVTTTTPGQNANVTFAGTAGQRVFLRLSNVTAAGTYVTIRKPDGTDFVARFWMSNSGSYVDTRVLPASGTYTIALDPEYWYTGSTTLTLYEVPPDISTGMSIDGSAVTVTTTTPGQNATVTFNGIEGQRVFLRLTNVSVSGTYVTIRKPDGSDFVARFWISSSGGFVDTRTLPATGTYTIVLDPEYWYTGSVTLTMYEVPADPSASITIGGPSLVVTTTTPGQNATVTFEGVTGQRIFLRISNVSLAGTYVTIRKPDGSDLLPRFWMSSSGTYVDTRTLPEPGTYSIFIDPEKWYTGSLTLTLYDVPADVTGTVTIGDPAVPVTITTPGQNGSLTVSGAQGQQVTVRITSNTMGTTTVKLLKPDGTTLTSSSSSSSAFNLTTQILPATGIYSIVIDPSQWNTGSLNVSVTTP